MSSKPDDHMTPGPPLHAVARARDPAALNANSATAAQPRTRRILHAFTLIKTAARSGLARSAGIYVVSYAVSLGIPMLILPFMTFYIDPDGFGHLAMFQMLMAVSIGVIGFSLQ